MKQWPFHDRLPREVPIATVQICYAGPECPPTPTSKQNVLDSPPDNYTVVTRTYNLLTHKYNFLTVVKTTFGHYLSG